MVAVGEPPVVGGVGDLPFSSGVCWDWPQTVAPRTLGAEEEKGTREQDTASDWAEITLL